MSYKSVLNQQNLQNGGAKEWSPDQRQTRKKEEVEIIRKLLFVRQRHFLPLVTQAIPTEVS